MCDVVLEIIENIIWLFNKTWRSLGVGDHLERIILLAAVVAFTQLLRLFIRNLHALSCTSAHEFRQDWAALVCARSRIGRPAYHAPRLVLEELERFVPSLFSWLITAVWPAHQCRASKWLPISYPILISFNDTLSIEPMNPLELNVRCVPFDK